MVARRSNYSVSVPVELQAWVANRLLRAHFRGVGAYLIIQLLCLAAVAWAIYAAVPALSTAFFCAAMLAFCWHRFYLMRGIDRSSRLEDPDRVIRALSWNSASIGLCVGIPFAAVLNMVGPQQQVIIGIAAITMVASAATAMRTLPLSAVYQAIPATIGLTIGFARVDLTLGLIVGSLALASASILCRTAAIAKVQFVTRILHERKLAEVNETVRMLLNDYESHGSDWLFELDSNGCMTGVSDRFAASAGQAPETMNGRPFVSLFEAGSARVQLADHLETRHAFRGHIAQLKRGDAAASTWWSINARPVTSGIDGHVAFRGVITDVSSEKQAEARVSHMAHYDSLTELPNRMMFNTTLAQMLDTRADAQRVALLVIDFDHFKSVNDMYGHPVGDAFLRLVGTRLADCVSNSGLGGEAGLVARLGGDEFGVVISGHDVADQSIRLGELLVSEFAQTFDVMGHELNAGVSIGIALAPVHADTPDALMSDADIALYVAKEEGRGRWEMFQPGMDEELHQRHTLARDLRSAVGNGELRLFLQPLVNVETGKHSGFEALMRWEHPERGMVMPNDFIPVAEETGLIVPMGEWMIRSALAEAVRWEEPHTIAINLSPIQLRSPNLIPTLINTLGQTGIDPARVELEITESVLLHNSDANIEILNRLHELGLKVALDDFGTGYASLNYLLTFPFDKIKIDRSFVNDLDSREESRAIVGAVISLANRLGMCTLAEGVEHESQLINLREQGCEMVQGWLFGKAMPASHYSPRMLPASEPVAALTGLRKGKQAKAA